jgi:hypothetical protein
MSAAEATADAVDLCLPFMRYQGLAWDKSTPSLLLKDLSEVATKTTEARAYLTG